MKGLLIVVLAFALAGCGGTSSRAVMVPSGDRLMWASRLGGADTVPDPALVRRVTEAASASGARVLEVIVLDQEEGHVPAVTLESSDPASSMKYRLRSFLERLDALEPDGIGFVELLDDHARFAWSGGHWKNGGMVHSRPDLDQCGPVGHSQPVGHKPPPCPVG